MTSVLRHYHWLAACLFAVWIILISFRVITKGQSLWVRLLVVGFLVNVGFFAVPQSFAVVLGGVLAYPLIQWGAKRDLLPSFDLASGKGLLVASCCLSLLQVALIAASDPGYALYFLRENLSYLAQLAGVYLGATVVGVSLAWALRLRWLIVLLVSLTLLFLANAYVFTLLLLPLLIGYALGSTAAVTSRVVVVLAVNAAVIALLYPYMSTFTLSGVGPYYPTDDAPWILGTVLSPFLFLHGALARSAPVR